MCLMWILLQFVVLAMYWDVPPLNSEEEGLMVVELTDDERELLVDPEDALDAYGAVHPDQSETAISSEIQPFQDTSQCPPSPPPSPPPSTGLALGNPFKNFSASRGVRQGVQRGCFQVCVSLSTHPALCAGGRR